MQAVLPLPLASMEYSFLAQQLRVRSSVRPWRKGSVEGLVVVLTEGILIYCLVGKKCFLYVGSGLSDRA